VLGEVWQGPQGRVQRAEAFGRFKLGAMSSGGVKVNIREAAKYAATRKQFNTPIALSGRSSTSSVK
jgi:alkylation response protein AidB-like acyl-CoA dehydrogenase